MLYFCVYTLKETTEHPRKNKSVQKNRILGNLIEFSKI